MTKVIISFHLFLISSIAFFYKNMLENESINSDIVICHTGEENNDNLTNVISAWVSPSSPFENDSTKTYSMPLLAQKKTGEVMLSWTEKDTQGMVSFCMAFSKDKGKTFSDKKVIYSALGIGNSRLMRAKILTKRDGSLIAVFSNRSEVTTAQNPNASGRGGGRSLDIVYCVSKDGGYTWSSPKSVDSDPKKGIVRGFFDATVLANDEIAVAYLKDVANSTKHEERDLRMVVTKNGDFQPEKLIDPVVCDCCNISLLVDANGVLHVYYRDNNDNIRDIAEMTSSDNATTFSKPQIIHDDKWEINGCPHNGPTSASLGKNNLVAWYSGATTESGIRLLDGKGKKLFVINDASAKNAFLLGDIQASILLWEQNNANNQSQIAYRKINNEKASETVWVDGASNATNATGLVVNNQLLMAYEIKQANKKNSIKISTVKL